MTTLLPNYLASRITLLAGCLLSPILVACCGCSGEIGPGVSTPENAVAKSFPQPAVQIASPEIKTESVAAPKAVAPEVKHDFGSQPVDTILERRFEIRNEGDAPLTLESEGTTCSCTVSTVDNQPVAPGKSGWVRLEWNVGKKVGPFSQWATIKTNDPKQRLIRINVIGMAQAEVEISPENLNWAELQRGKDAQDQVLVTSQAWPNLKIDDVKCSVAGLSWEIEPATSEELKLSTAKAGRRIVLRIPAELTRTEFRGSLEFRVSPVGVDGKPYHHKMEIYGGAPKGLFLSGSCQVGQAAVFGLVRQGVAKKCNLLLQAKGFDETFRIDQIITEPSFVRCTAEPILAKGKNVGVFRVTVEIPADAPECVYQTPDVGVIRLLTNHPEKPELKFFVEFSVIP